MRTILVVDDDAAVRTVMARFLRIKGFVVIEAGNGQEALTHRADPSIADIPVIVTSGADAHRFHELKAAATFQKPVTISKVVKVLEDLLAIP